MAENSSLKKTLTWFNTTRKQLVSILSELDARWKKETDLVKRNRLWNARSEPEAELARVKRAILDLIEEDLTVNPPDEATVTRTEELSNALQAVRLKEAQLEAILTAVSDIGNLVTRVLKSKA
jgi:ABC-type transporter Mla subunit MlaD